MELPRDDDGKLSSWAWPGGYPIFYVTGDGMVVCPKCANTETSDDPIAADVNWEDASLFCDDCSQRIESAYAEDDVKPTCRECGHALDDNGECLNDVATRAGIARTENR